MIDVGSPYQCARCKKEDTCVYTNVYLFSVYLCVNCIIDLGRMRYLKESMKLRLNQEAAKSYLARHDVSIPEYQDRLEELLSRAFEAETEYLDYCIYWMKNKKDTLNVVLSFEEDKK